MEINYMNSITSIIGIILIIFGIAVLGYQGVTYTKQEKIAEIGNVKVTADTEKTIFFPPVVGGVSIVAGIVLVALAKMNKK